MEGGKRGGLAAGKFPKNGVIDFESLFVLSLLTECIGLEEQDFRFVPGVPRKCRARHFEHSDLIPGLRGETQSSQRCHRLPGSGILRSRHLEEKFFGFIRISQVVLDECGFDSCLRVLRGGAFRGKDPGVPGKGLLLLPCIQGACCQMKQGGVFIGILLRAVGNALE